MCTKLEWKSFTSFAQFIVDFKLFKWYGGSFAWKEMNCGKMYQVVDIITWNKKLKMEKTEIEKVVTLT